MKILITGHKGFIGKNLFNFLKNKNIEVDGFDKKKNFNIPSIKNYDWVIHLGANSSTVEKNVKKILDQNYFFSVALLNLCLKHNINFQYASSASIYDKEFGFKETSKCLPVSPYSWSKYLFDIYVEKLKHRNIIQGFRYFNVYGNNENNKKEQASPIYKFYKNSILKNEIKLFKNSHKYKRDFVCINDICDIHYKMLFQKKSGIYNIGTGRSVSFKKIATLIAKKNKAKIKYISMPENLKKHYQTFTKAENKKITKLLKIKWHRVEDYIKKNNNFLI